MEETSLHGITFEHDEEHDSAVEKLKDLRGKPAWDDVLEGRETFKATVDGYTATFEVERVNAQRYRIRKKYS